MTNGLSGSCAAGALALPFAIAAIGAGGEAPSTGTGFVLAHCSPARSFAVCSIVGKCRRCAPYPMGEHVAAASTYARRAKDGIFDAGLLQSRICTLPANRPAPR